MAIRKRKPIGYWTQETMLVLRMDAAKFFELIESTCECAFPDDFVISVSDKDGHEVIFTRKTKGITIHGEGVD